GSRMHHACLDELDEIRQSDETSAILDRSKRQRQSEIDQTQEFAKICLPPRPINQRWSNDDALHAPAPANLADRLLRFAFRPAVRIARIRRVVGLIGALRAVAVHFYAAQE